MAGGGHFLSDVIWSALLAYGVCHILYYYVLRIPCRESLESPHRSRRARKPIGTI